MWKKPLIFLILNLIFLFYSSNESIIDICQLFHNENGYIADKKEGNNYSFELTTARDVCGQIEVFTNKSPEASDDELDTPTPKVKAKTRIAK